MIIDVLSIDKTFLDSAKELRDLKTFFEALWKTPGDPDKPLRILRNGVGGYVVAKFALTTQRRYKAMADEWSNLEKCQNLHVIQYLWGGKYEGHIMILMEYTEPFLTFSTVRDLCAASDLDFRNAVFKILFTVSLLQKKFRGFRHNDLKADNVMVTHGPPRSYAFTSMGLRRTFFTPAGVDVKLIDFELATSESELSSTTVSDGSLIMRSDFGISDKRCDVYDIHLLAYDCLRTLTPTILAFQKFIFAFIPSTFFDPVNLTCQFRLKFEDQDKLQSILGPDILVKMMCHPYFFHLRGDHDAKTEIEI
jgi:serine/threonine protein kinase